MSRLVPDPMAADGIEGFGRRMRAGQITAERATATYLERIAALDPKLGAFEHVAGESALRTARAIDQALAAGLDLGPLMGVPVAIKDLFAVDGTPTTAGSDVDVADMIGGEGSFVKSLRRAGCVILGKTKTVEFALGGAGTNAVRGTPRNPWDAKVHRAPGGSSSGSAVAMAAGMCGFAIGSDTGGSVRGPAAWCGVFGLKTTKDLWPTDGVFPLSPTLDTIGPMTRSAADCAIVLAALTGQATPTAAPVDGLRLGLPRRFFFDNLDADVAKCTDAMLARLRDAGAEIVEIDIPEVENLSATFGTFSAAELIAGMGRERFLANQNRLDPVVAGRARLGLDVKADAYIRLVWRHHELRRIMDRRLETEGFDGWITPSRSFVAPPVAKFSNDPAGIKFAGITGLNTRPGNIFGLCATSTPIQQFGPSTLPVGFQVMCRAGHDSQAVAIALAFESLAGKPPVPDLAAFL